MFKKFIIAMGGFAVLVITLGAVKVAQIQKMTSAPHVMPPSAVATTEAKATPWSPSLRSIGTLAPVEGVTLSADAEGAVVKIYAENGAAVKAGDPLIELDSSVEAAQLAAADARTELARVNLERTRELLSRNAISKSELDTSDAVYKQAVADAGALKALIEKKTVRAPFSGRVGIRQVNLGQYISKGRALLPLQKLDPIYVNFSVPQRQLPELSIGRKVNITIDAFAGKTFEGTISAINSEVDAATRNISVQATMANPDEQLRSGMFAQVEVELPSGSEKIALPATAINYAPYGNSVFVVEKMKGQDGKEYLGVRQQFVKLGDTRGDLVAVEEGVKPGEQIVTAGVFKLRNGMHVEVNNNYQPSSNPAPKPANT
ncbi:MAG TPA: efflux RND transporter periplasmic adaptor subunit [Candidatus Didemnitutus sp.]|nr:efflux RND transporter periplasmic adaptor subunit [Candidatus Didemnitutus sp.]